MNTEQRRLALIKAKEVLREEAKEERIARGRRLARLALRRERKARAARKAVKTKERLTRERKALAYRTWKKTPGRKKEERKPKDIDFRSAQHLTSERRYSWMVKLNVYNHKNGTDETHFIGVSDNKRLSDREVKDKAVEILHTTETSPEYDLFSVEIVRKTVDRGYEEII